MDNPSSSPSVYTMRDMYRRTYQDKFEKLLVREQGGIGYKVYNVGDVHDTHYFCFKIPSETLAGLYYDVIIKLWAGSNELKNSANFREYYVQFFSNDQAFTYTFEYSFNKNHLLIPELKDKCSQIALKRPAEIKNPKNEVWYVKSFCFAFFAMERYLLFNRSVANQIGLKYNKSEFLAGIASFDKKMEEHAQKTQELKTQKQKEKEAAYRAKQLEKNKYIITKSTSPAKSTKVAKVSKVAKVTKTSKVTSVPMVKSRGR